MYVSFGIKGTLAAFKTSNSMLATKGGLPSAAEGYCTSTIIF